MISMLITLDQNPRVPLYLNNHIMTYMKLRKKSNEFGTFFLKLRIFPAEINMSLSLKLRVE